MDNITFGETPFLVIVSADRAQGCAGVEWAGPITSAETLARPRPGYGGAIWLTQGRVLGAPSTPDAELLIGLLFWRNSSDAECLAAELRRTPVDELSLDEGIYRFSASVTASPDSGSPVNSTSIRSESANEIIRMTPVSGKQEWIIEYNESETRDHIRSLDGFVSTSFFRDLRSDRIVEYVQWRSAEDLTAAFGDARFAEHMSVNSHYSEGEAPLFGERSAGSAPIAGPFGHSSTSADPDGYAVTLRDKA